MVVDSWALKPLVRKSDIFEDGWQKLTYILEQNDLCDVVPVLPPNPLEKERERDQFIS